MILSQEQWMELHACKALAEAGATWAEIARETGHDWRTVKRYLTTQGIDLAAGTGQARAGPTQARPLRRPGRRLVAVPAAAEGERDP